MRLCLLKLNTNNLVRSSSVISSGKKTNTEEKGKWTKT